MYKKFISMHSVVDNTQGNIQAIAFVTTFLESIGFDIRMVAEGDTEQPTIIANYPGRLSDNKIVLYGHYDVAPVNLQACWGSEDPFALEKINGRLYGRGIADNKGPLLARMLALQALVLSGNPIPTIMWLIQGEEEITQGDRVAQYVFENEIPAFGAKVYIEETGFNDLDTDTQISFLWSPNLTASQLVSWHELLQMSLDGPRIEYRHLNKLNGIEACPLLSNLPKDAVYMGFGPNDRLHFIHQDNESLDEGKLSKHQHQFETFLMNYALYNHAS